MIIINKKFIFILIDILDIKYLILDFKKDIKIYI